MVTTSEVPGIYQVGINGRAFPLDLASDQFVLQTVDIIRQQGDSSAQTGESTINPQDLWRRSISSWHEGAGQNVYDGAESSPFRFSQSRRVNPSVRGELSLQERTNQVFAMPEGTEYNSLVMTIGSKMYWTLGFDFKYTTNVTDYPSAYTVIHTFATDRPRSFTTDGYNIWVSAGLEGIWAAIRDVPFAAAYITSPVGGVVAYLKGRLFASHNNVLYNITAGGVLPVTLATGRLLVHPNPDWQWVGYAEGSNYVYVGGYSGSLSTIYRVTMQPDGTALGVPEEVWSLPHGETLTGMIGYQGFIVVGTDKGFRLVKESGGNFEFGPLVQVADGIGVETGDSFNPAFSRAVRSFYAFENYIYFGIDGIDFKSSAGSSVTSGVGRMDLSVFTAPLTPAWWCDAEYTYDTVFWGYASAVTSVTIFDRQVVFSLSQPLGVANLDNRPQMAVQNKPAVGNSTSYCPTGFILTGDITYGLSDPKIPGYLDTVIKNDDGPTYGAYVFTTVTTDRPQTLALPHVTSANFGEQSVLLSSARTMSLRTDLVPIGSTILTATLQRLTLRSEPAPTRSTLAVLPILLTDEMVVGSQLDRRTVDDDLTYLMDLTLNSDMFIDVQIAGSNFKALTQNFRWVPNSLTVDGIDYVGTFIMSLKIVSS